SSPLGPTPTFVFGGLCMGRRSPASIARGFRTSYALARRVRSQAVWTEAEIASQLGYHLAIPAFCGGSGANLRVCANVTTGVGHTVGDNFKIPRVISNAPLKRWRFFAVCGVTATAPCRDCVPAPVDPRESP